MQILVLNGSPRPHGNTAAMVEAFRKGAEENSHAVIVVHGLPEIDGVQHAHFIAGGGQHFSALHDQRPLRVLSIRNKKKVSCF